MGPDGLIFHLSGPHLGKRHDMAVLRDSGLLDVLADHAQDEQGSFYLYGDSGYTMHPNLICPFKGIQCAF